jgi:hypothetical protein
VTLWLRQAPEIPHIGAEFRALQSRVAQQVLLITQIPHPNYLCLEITTLAGIYIKIQPVLSFLSSMDAVRRQQRESIYHFTSTPIVA